MTKPAHPYSSYLLRIWRAAEGQTPTWRAYLQDLTTGKRLGFANLESLFAFFETVSAAPTDPVPAEGGCVAQDKAARTGRANADALRKEDAHVETETDD